jgi:Flp pilus assembly protein TadG
LTRPVGKLGFPHERLPALSTYDWTDSLSKKPGGGASHVKRRRTAARSGVAAVELAVVLPFLAFLFLIAVDYGRVFYYSQIVENCARNGALYASDPKASNHNLYSTVQDAALADAGNLSPQPTVTSSSGTDATGNPYVQVTVSWQFQTVANYPGIPSTVNLSNTVQMRQAP